LAKFVDITCVYRDAVFRDVFRDVYVFRDAGGAAGQGAAVKQLSAIGTKKNKKPVINYVLFLFNNNVDFKKNNRNYRKSF